MADLLIRLEDGRDRESGDVIFAAQDKHVFMCHAENICNRKHFRAGHTLPRGTLAEDYYIRTHEYKFERTGNSVSRTALLTNDIIVFESNKPFELDGKMVQMDVEQFIAKALKHPGHKIFGSTGSEVWYGGKLNHDGLDALWSDIEAKTGRLKADHSFWPFSESERKNKLALPIEDFDDKEMERLTEPLYLTDDNGEFILDEAESKIVEKFRRTKIRWRDLLDDLQITERYVLDKEFSIDLRDKPRIRQHIFRDKKPNKAGL